MQLLIRRLNSLIDISPDGYSPLPDPIANLLMPQLTYTHKTTLHGADAWEPGIGQRTGIVMKPRAMYTSEGGRLTTGFGFFPKITRLLQTAGHDVRFVDLSPPRARPRCYEMDWPTVRRLCDFRPKQEDCLQAIAQSPGGIINATMGFGKTHTFTMISLLYPWAKIAIVVKPVDVAHRIVRQLTRHHPIVGMVGGGERTLGRVTVYTAGSVHYCDGDVDILLADEGHQLMSADISEKMGQIFTRSRNYTFTATPEARLDGAHAMLECLFGPTIFYLGYPEAVRLGLVVPIRVRWLDVPMSLGNPAAGKTGVPWWRWGIWRNQIRNQIIAADVRTQHPDPNEQVLISVATVDHAMHLWQFLPEFELCYAGIELENFERHVENGFIPRSFQRMTTDRRDRMREAFERGQLKKVIATDVWSTGVDFEQLPVLYRADARDSEILSSQWPGRVSRIFDGKEYGEIVDCRDMWDGKAKRKAQQRHRHYAHHEWEQDWVQGRRQISRG